MEISNNFLITLVLTLMLSSCVLNRSAQTVSDDKSSPGPIRQQSPSFVEPLETTAETTTISDEKVDERLLFKRTNLPQASLNVETQIEFSNSTIELNFVDAPASEVARIIIGKAFGQPLAIAGFIDERISLQAEQAVSAHAAIALLEDTLAATDLLIVETNSGFLLRRRSDASNVKSAGGSNVVGFGVQSIPIENSRPSQILRLIEPFLNNSVTLTANDGEALIFAEGTATEISELREIIARFDTPDRRGRVYGIFSPNYVDAASLKSEIEPLLNSTFGETNQIIELLPIPRLNQLFVLTRTTAQFERVEDWIQRLDKPSFGDEQRLYYYRVRNAPADVLASQLETVFQPGRGSTPLPGPNVTSGPNRTTTSLGSQTSSLSVIADELNNALIIRATGNQYRDILMLLEETDVLAPQVLIEATIAEVTLTDDLRFGLRWFFTNDSNTIAFTDNPGGSVGSVFPGFSATYLDGVDATVAIDALSSITDVSILSAPSILVQNNQSANLQVGDEVPIVVQQAVSVSDPNAPIVSTVQLRETGVILEVKPRISSSDIVVIDVQQEVSEVAAATTEGIDTPTIQQRQFSSTVAVSNGGTVALGGLIRETQTTSEVGIPGLRRIPLAGRLFKSSASNNRRTELIIFLRPSIVRTSEDNQLILDSLSQDSRALGGALDDHLSR